MKTSEYPSSQVQVPVFLMDQTFWKFTPGFTSLPSGIVMSPSKTALLQASPKDAVGACPPAGIAAVTRGVPASGVVFVLLLKDTVGITGLAPGTAEPSAG